MRVLLLGFLLSLPASLAGAQSIVPPEVVRFENVNVEGELKTITMGNARRHYSLYCNTKVEGCITPEANQDYYLVTKNTRFQMNGAKGFMTLSFIQDWTATYNSGENIGLVATDASKANVLGVFLLDTTGVISKTSLFQTDQ